MPDDVIQVSSWDELYEACQNAPDNVSTTIVLSEDITRPSDSDNDRIEINNKKVIVLDLNDKTLHANRTSAGKYYHVLDVHEGGNLTVLDSGFSGTIKGGYANYGGGIYISEGGTCTIEGGTISSNYAEEKGGGDNNQQGTEFAQVFREMEFLGEELDEENADKLEHGLCEGLRLFLFFLFSPFGFHLGEEQHILRFYQRK